MIMREVTVGRGKDCDIYLDPGCKYASNHHATIYYDGNNLMFKDTSSNGTMINNIDVRQRAVMIHRGDTIMLAGRYQISWNQIDIYFPPTDNVSVGNCNGGGMRGSQVSVGSSVSRVGHSVLTAPETSKWNWGAFFMYPIWGCFNGCSWAILVAIFFFWLNPIPNIVFGIYGTRWAWNNKRWGSVTDFENTQRSWGIAGVVITVTGIVFTVLFYVLFFISLY